MQNTSSILTKVTSGRRGRAQKVVIYAPEGFGKSTLGSRFPNPIFFDVEDSTSQLEVARLGRDSLPDLRTFESALAEVAKSRPCESLIVDTIDWLEQMALDDVIAEAGNPKIKGIEDFGYGKGYTVIKERVTILLARFDAVIAAGINVVLLAHSKVTKFEPPDGAGPYDRYELKLTKQVAPLIKEWADMLLFGNWRVQVREKDKNEAGAQFKGVGGKERLLYCNRTAAWDAKNRHQMADVEPWGIEAIQKAFLAVGAPWGEPAPETKSPAVAAGAPEPTAKPDEKFTPAAPANEVAPETKAVSVSAEPEKPAPPPIAQEQLAAKANGVATHHAELVRICDPNSEAITAYLRDHKKIGATETWEQMPQEFAARVLKNPAGFLKQVNARKAVSA